MGIDWKRKLTSRKFWALIAGFVTGLIVYITNPEKTPEAIGGLIMILGSIFAYMVGEGLSDGSDNNVTYNIDKSFALDKDECEENKNG